MNGWRRTSATVALAACVVAGACKKSETPAAGGAPAGQTAAAPTAFPVADADQATVNGRVAFTGTKPANPRIDMSEEPTCSAKHTGGVTGEAVMVNDNGTLRNVFVYVESGLPASMTIPVPSEAVEIDQDGCMYKPHVFGIQVGQALNIKNSDGILHNIKATPTNQPALQHQPADQHDDLAQLHRDRGPGAAQCNVHSWMNGFVGVLPHPYFSVTGADGTFSLRRLPPGTYVIKAWQEHYPAQTQTVTVGAHETKDIVFTFHG